MPSATLMKVEQEALLKTLQERFEKNRKRHEGHNWASVLARLAMNQQALSSLSAMERTGGEPDVIGKDDATGEYIFCDCSAESPAGRRSICYDPEGQERGKGKACP